MEKLMLECSADETAFITAAYEQILSRPPTDPEVSACREFLEKQGAQMDSTFAQASLVRVLFNHNDFVNIR
jgi:hypothetical protein